MPRGLVRMKTSTFFPSGVRPNGARVTLDTYCRSGTAAAACTRPTSAYCPPRLWYTCIASVLRTECSAPCVAAARVGHQRLENEARGGRRRRRLHHRAIVREQSVDLDLDVGGLRIHGRRETFVLEDAHLVEQVAIGGAQRCRVGEAPIAPVVLRLPGVPFQRQAEAAELTEYQGADRLGRGNRGSGVGVD